ncbi:MAG: NAD(P)-dependent oxidoreductase [Rhodospirillales bacterium]|nr:NAD(P)-dependent oxidoreductase [Rhodospirillales bacterium]
MANTAFIGLGVMGFPMAGHLVKAGHQVTVYNRSPKRAQEWVKKHGGKMAKTPAAAAKDADVVFSCVGNDDHLRQVAFGNDGILAGMKRGAVYCDHTTASAGVAKEIDAEARKRGIGFLDGPVSGGQAGAENGVLTVMVGGDRRHFDVAAPVIKAYARAVTLLGPVGAGQVTKAVNQVCIVGMVQGLAEGLAFAERAGLDAKKVVGVIAKGAAQSWQMDNRALTMIDDKFDFGFATKWMHKDLGIALAEAKKCRAHLPATALINQFYAQLLAVGGERWDSSCLIRNLTRGAKPESKAKLKPAKKRGAKRDNKQPKKRSMKRSIKRSKKRR